MDYLILLPVLVPFFCGVFGLVFKSLKARQILGVLGPLVSVIVASFLLYYASVEGYLVTELGSWSAPFGIVFVVDIFSGIMVLLTSVMGFLVAIYALHDIDKQHQRLHYHPLFNFLMMGVHGAFLTGDIFNLYVWFEVILINSFILIVLEGKRPQIEGAFKYVIINLIASAFFLAGAGLLYAKLGTLNMADIASKLSSQPDAVLIHCTAALFMIAFAIKSAMFPFFFWLPASYHTPPIAISAFMAGLLTKVGVYALIRASSLLFQEGFQSIEGLWLFLAVGTMITGVLGAAAQFNIRKILTFHVVSQIGYLILGLTIMTPLALAGTLFFMVHVVIVKTNLILIAGVIERLKGTSDLAVLGSVYRKHPYLAICFLVSALSLAGLPPLSGFWAKFVIIKASLIDQHYLAAALALAVGMITLFSMTKIWGEAFWKEQAEPQHDSSKITISKFLYAPIFTMVAFIVYLGIWGDPVFALAEKASEQLLQPNGYINAVLPTKGLVEK